MCFFDSGLEYPETHDHIERLASVWQLNLHVIKCEPTALEFMVRSGFWDHTAIGDLPTEWGSLHDTLIRRPAAEAHAAYGPGLVIGIRAEESARRAYLAALTGGRLRMSGGVRSLAPIIRWSHGEVLAYHARHHIPLNPVYARLEELGVAPKFRRVGLVLDGNCLQFGRAVWLRRGWPDLWVTLAQALPRLREMG